MTMHNLVKVVGVAAALSGFAVSTADASNHGFVKKAGCYTAMKVKCDGGKCTNDEYNESIEWCDEIFSNSEEEPAPFEAKANGVLKLLFKR